MAYLTFNGNDFESIRLQLNTLHDIPPEGKNGYRNGVEVTDGSGKTMNYLVCFSHPTLDKTFIPKIDGLPQYVMDTSSEELTEAEMVTAGFWENVV